MVRFLMASQCLRNASFRSSSVPVGFQCRAAIRIDIGTDVGGILPSL